MAITDAGVPALDPWNVLKTFIETNMNGGAAFDGWTPVVNDDWLEFKKQKQYQICIVPQYGLSREMQLNGSITDNPTEGTLYLGVTLYAPSRAKRWTMYRHFKAMFDNQTITAPLDGTGYTGVGGSDYHFIRLERSEESKVLRWTDDSCGPGEKGDCLGYRTELTVQIRWNE